MSISGYLLDPATKHPAVIDRVKRVWRDVQRGEYFLALALRRLFNDNVHRGRSSSTFGVWADHELGIPLKLANSFNFIGSHLERLPLTRKAMDEGRLTYTKAREFVALATPENEAEWIEFAITHTNRDLEREVARKRRGTPEETREVTSRVTPAEAQAVRQARECLMKLTDRPVPADKVLPLLAETALGRGLFEGGNGVSADAPPVKPYLTIALDPFTFHTWVPTPEGDLDVPILDWVRALRDGAPVEEFVTKYFCDCEDEIHRRDLCPHYRPSDGPAPTSRHVPVEVRRRIEARDGSRCRVPGCLNAGPLEIGHFRPHRDGGPMTEENLGKQCEACNKMIESKTLKVEGEAPFERYHRWDDSFLGYGCDHRPFPHVGQDGLPVGLAPGDPPEGHEPHA